MLKILSLIFTGIVLAACAGLPASAPTPEPLATPTSASITACSLPAQWSIELNRSGGFAGLNESLTLDSGGSLQVQSERPAIDVQKQISQDQVDEITDLLVQACPFEIELPKKECADCFVYNLDVRMDEHTYSVQISDLTFNEEMQPLLEALNQLAQDVEP